MARIKISFLERHFVTKEDQLGTTIGGFDPAIIETPYGVKVGRVLHTERLCEPGYVDVALFQTSFPLGEVAFDVGKLLEANDGGIRWISSFNNYFKKTFDLDVPLEFKVSQLTAPSDVVYTLFPNDIERNCSFNYRNPRAIVNLNKTSLHYLEVRPPMKFANGEWISTLYYQRKVRDLNNIFGSYSIRDLKSSDDFRSLPGTFFGNLQESEIRVIGGDFQNSFPISHYLDVVYPISLRQIGEFNPLTINVEVG